MIGGYLNGKWSGKMSMRIHLIFILEEEKTSQFVISFLTANMEINKLCMKKKNIACTIQVCQNLKLASEV